MHFRQWRRCYCQFNPAFSLPFPPQHHTTGESGQSRKAYLLSFASCDVCCCICCPSSFTPGIPARDYRCFPKIEPSLFFFSYYCLTRLRLLFLHAGPQTSARDGTEQCGETSQRWRCAAHHLRLYSLCLYSLKREERKKKDADYLFSLLLSFCYFFLSLFSFLFV